MKKIAVLLLLCCAASLSARAQYVQGGGINAAPDTIGGDWTAKPSYSFTFNAPLVAPCTIIVTARFGFGTSGTQLSDTQNNQFLAVPGSNSIIYSSSCHSGPDTVTGACPGGTPCWTQFTVSQYSGVWMPDQVSAVNTGTSTSGSTVPVTPTQNGELIFGIGSNSTTNTPGITATNGFALRTNVNEFIEDMTQTTAAPIASTVTYSSAVSWGQTTISFKPGGSPQHQAALSWTDSLNPSGTQYNVYRSAGPSCTSFIRLNGNPVSALTYTDATIVSGQSYCFEVRAIIGTTESIAGDNLFLVVQ